MRGPVLLAAAAAVLAACGGSDEPSGRTAQDAETQTCSLVRAGIDAFNAGDYERTVDVFGEARGPAADFADLSDDPVADDLLTAVDYYAALPADDYLEAFRTSQEFHRHQAVTLGLCETGQGAEPGRDDGVAT